LHIFHNIAVLLIFPLSDEFSSPAPQVFISYSWDNQEEVLLLRSELDKSGLTCWMDIGQMGGGDYLYNQIYKGINLCRVRG
jgi:hypothetical protein